MAVNGIEIKVGQKWETRDGVVVTIRSRSGTRTHPWVDDESQTYTENGVFGSSTPGSNDLVTLLNDVAEEDPAPAPVPHTAGVNGIKIRYGQVWLTSDNRRLEVKERNPDHAVLWDGHGHYWWFHLNGVSRADPNLRLMKLDEGVATGAIQVDQTPAPVLQAVEIVPANGLMPDISEVDRATGKVKLSVIEDLFPDHEEEARKRVLAKTAPGLLDAAAGHMRDRAATYDKPEGERSIAQVVTAFNAIHNTDLTEAQGWHFMSLLKQVRAFSGKAHRDSVEDNVAYAALMGEAMLKGGAQ